MMASRAYSTKNTWYIEYEVTGPPEQKDKYAGEVIPIPAVRGTAKSTNHKSNVLDLIKQMYPKVTTLADIGITKAKREAKILQAIAESYSVPQSNPDKEATRKRLEAFVHETRASETVAKAMAQEEIDMLEGDPAHRGMAMRNARFKPFWLTAEARTIVFLRADTSTKLSDQPKLELLIASRHVLLYEVSRWRKERTMIKISLRLPA
jgi:hypothetical protein